ncbi:hypothetical protein HAZT_HAZT009401 [Hyalella azteca]|uniref:Uncharacterized protein n=1 Tax=Hyalella azteca TaxID=294128 RepID=A0A6A0GQ35_HYAAZ|nr:hypothetical protein HAZT_HAZT009401 [Hyalella azteca]
MDERRCNGVKDCIGNFDEIYCTTCKGQSFFCNGLCVLESASSFCNGVDDCADAADEANCPSCLNSHFTCDGVNVHCSDPRRSLITCGKDEFFCDDLCHPNSVRCNATAECRDGSDEANCTSCADDFFVCDERCVATTDSRRCDGVVQCTNGTDEMSCTACTGNSFRCNDSCLPITDARYCDGFVQCNGSTDENSCQGTLNKFSTLYPPI